MCPPEFVLPCSINIGCRLRHGSSHLPVSATSEPQAHVCVQVGANEVVQQIFGFVSDAFAQHQSRSLVTERQLLAAMAATQQQGAAQQEQLQAALGALGSMHRAVQGVLSLPPQQTVSVKQVGTGLCLQGLV